MSNAAELAAATYIRCWTERDLAKRAQMIDACWAEDGRLVTTHREIRGRAALAKEMDAFQADPQWKGIVLLSVIDTGRTIFRFRGVAERHDGTTAEAFDAGEIDANGKIVTIYTFNGPLRDA